MNAPLRDIRGASIGPSRPIALLTIPSSTQENSEMNSKNILRVGIRKWEEIAPSARFRPPHVISESVLPALNHRL